ncbi:hypothetical protein [Microbacterium deminutum]
MAERKADPGPLEPGILRRVLGMWALGRIFSLALLGCWYVVSRGARWNFGPYPMPVTSYMDFLAGWDADRYGAIAEYGYPQAIPVDASGDVMPNNWAFLPVFPMLERALAAAAGMPWQIAGVVISIAASAGATVMLFLLVRRVASGRQAWWAAVLFTFGPLSFVFSLAYAESLFLLLLFSALLLAVLRRYAWITPIGVVAGFTRPGVVALALGLAVVFAVRWMRRRHDPFRIREMAGLGAAVVTTAIAGFAWPFIADAVTGLGNVYVRTETAWWIPFVGDGAFVPLTPWFRFAITYAGPIGAILVVLVIAAFAWWVSSRPVRRLGIEVVAFAAAYGIYLFAVFLPQQSILRLVMPLSPLLGDERLSATPRRRRWLLATCLALQAVAVFLLWTIGYP